MNHYNEESHDDVIHHVTGLDLPPSWATATPAIRRVAAALSPAGPGAPDVAKASGSGVWGRLTPLKDLKDSTSPEKLKRLVAQISEKPESVQHHRVDQEGLDGLLESRHRCGAPVGRRQTQSSAIGRAK